MIETKSAKAFYNTEIPSDWEVKHFEDVAAIDKESLKGNTPKDYEFDYISLSDVDSDDFKIETTKQVFASAPSRARRVVNQGDIIMSTVRPNLQGFSLIRNDAKDLIASTGFAVITAKKCSNEFLFQYLFSSGIERQFYQLLVGSNYPAINSSDVRKLKISLPPLPEQRAIANVLGKMDEAINANNQLISQKELRKKWLMQNLLTGKKRLKGFSGEWKEVKFGAFLKESRIKGNSGDIAKKITVKLYGNGVFAKSDKTKGSKNTQYFIRKSDQFIYSKLDFLNGAFGIIPQELNDYESTLDLPCFDINTSKVNKAFLLSFVTRKDFYKRYDDGAIGGRKAKRIQVTEFLNIKPQFPALQEQTAIAQILQAADKELNLLKTKTDKLKEQKKGMMQVLLTGKKRLKLSEQDFKDLRNTGLTEK